MRWDARHGDKRRMVVFPSGSLSSLADDRASHDNSREAYTRISELRGETLKVLSSYSGLSIDGRSDVGDIIVALQGAANELGSAERRILAILPRPAA
jgi:hypothetical protein